jgi:hypothetical protein
MDELDEVQTRSETRSGSAERAPETASTICLIGFAASSQ